MSTVAELRAKIAARRTTDLARVDICIDRDQAQTIADIEADPNASEAALDAAWAGADEHTLTVLLQTLPPIGEGSYQEIFDRHTEAFAEQDFPAAWCADVAAACYLRAETTTGDNLGYTWDELLPFLFHGDYERVWRAAVIHNRKSPQFNPRTRASLPADSEGGASNV